MLPMNINLTNKRGHIMSIDNLSVFSGNANPDLAAQVVDYLKAAIGQSTS